MNCGVACMTIVKNQKLFYSHVETHTSKRKENYKRNKNVIHEEHETGGVQKHHDKDIPSAKKEFKKLDAYGK